VRPASALAALALAAAVALAACGDDDGVDVEGVDAAALLRSAAERTERAQSFHFVLEHENGATQIVRGLEMERAEGDVAGADRLSVEIKASLGPLNLELSIIVIGDDAWITNPLTRRWEREQISISEVFDPANGVTGLMRAASGARVAGSDSVGGVSTYRVEATVDSGDVTLFGDPRPGTELRARVWIGVDDPLVYRIELVGAVTAGEPDDLVRRITLSRFDEDIEIVPPR
jgi:hypothetical protein